MRHVAQKSQHRILRSFAGGLLLANALTGCGEPTAPIAPVRAEVFTLVRFVGGPLPVPIVEAGGAPASLVGGEIRFSNGVATWTTIYRGADGRERVDRVQNSFVASGPYRVLGRSDTLVVQADTLHRLGEPYGMVFVRASH